MGRVLPAWERPQSEQRRWGHLEGHQTPAIGCCVPLLPTVAGGRVTGRTRRAACGAGAGTWDRPVLAGADSVTDGGVGEAPAPRTHRKEAPAGQQVAGSTVESVH